MKNISLQKDVFEGFERFISLSKDHKAPVACTKLPQRLKTNLRYETSPQSRPVVGNTKLGELYWVLSDNKTSPQVCAVRAKTDRRNNFRQVNFILNKIIYKQVKVFLIKYIFLKHRRDCIYKNFFF